jgi:hypothetical protein
MHIGYYKGIKCDTCFLLPFPRIHKVQLGRGQIAALGRYIPPRVRVVLYMDVFRTYNISWMGGCVNRIMIALS